MRVSWKSSPSTANSPEDKKVKVLMFPNTRSALVSCPAPSARDKTELPPIPMARPSAAIKKVIGITTVMAEIANGPIQRPTKMVSTIMFNDMTKIPIEAGTACFISRLLIDLVPNESEFFFKDLCFSLWSVYAMAVSVFTACQSSTQLANNWAKESLSFKHGMVLNSFPPTS